jgi:hypothetical protein
MWFNLLSHSFSTAAWASGLWMMHRERCGPKCSLSVWRHCPRIYFEELKNPTKTPSRELASVPKTEPDISTIWNCLSRLCHELDSPVFTSLDFVTIICLQSKVAILASNTQPAVTGLCIYGFQWQGDPVILPGTRFTFLRLLWLAELQCRYSNSPPHRNMICIYIALIIPVRFFLMLQTNRVMNKGGSFLEILEFKDQWNNATYDCLER